MILRKLKHLHQSTIPLPYVFFVKNLVNNESRYVEMVASMVYDEIVCDFPSLGELMDK